MIFFSVYTLCPVAVNVLRLSVLKEFKSSTRQYDILSMRAGALNTSPRRRNSFISPCFQ